MNEQDKAAFKDWSPKRQPVSAEDIWQAACEYKDKQYNPFDDLPDWVQEAIQRQATIDSLKEQLAARDAAIVDVTEKLVGCMSSVKSELANFERVIDELHRTDQQRTPAYEAVSREQTRLRRLLNAIEEADAGQLCVDEGCPHSNIEHVCISARDAVIVKLREALKDATIEIECTSGTDMSCEPKADCSNFYAALAIPNDDSALREYAEDWLNKSPEMALLNQIEDLLEPVEYEGSYVDGIKAMVKQAQREGQSEMRKRAAKYFVGFYSVTPSIISALPIEGENE